MREEVQVLEVPAVQQKRVLINSWLVRIVVESKSIKKQVDSVDESKL